MTNLLSRPRSGALRVMLLVAAAALLGLHYVHLAADFPNYSPWMDWSKYTDEGWYGDAAIRHFQLGHWYVPGDFNPAAALPVWPFLEALLFRFTGVSLVAARALTVSVFGCILMAAYLLLRRWSPPRSLAPAVAVLLLAVSPFCFVFTRLAILEPLLVLLVLLAMLAASAAPTHRVSAIIALGLLLPLLILTKTTGVFLLPGIAWILFAASGYQWRTFLKLAIPAGVIALGLWLGYFLLIVRPHYLLDYRYLFSANAYTGITRENAVSVVKNTFRDGMWMGRLLFPLSLAAVVLGLTEVARKRLREHPLVPALVLWAGGYTAFLAYHNNLQPRYYLVVAVPLTLLLVYVLEQVAVPVLARLHREWLALSACALAIAAIAIPDAHMTVHFVRHPEYTLVNAAADIHHYIDADRRTDPGHSPLVLSISGSDLSLMTGLPSICDDFGTLQLVDRVKRYRPGWYLAWNQIDDDKMDALTPLYHVERVATFPAMDDPERNLLVLYRLDPSIVTKPDIRHRKTIPKNLRTRVGQQPTASQLEH